MNITRLKIENFKCFGEKTEIPLAPITLIYGENGAGKSAILQSVQLLRNGLGASGLVGYKFSFSHRTGIDNAQFSTVSHNGDESQAVTVCAEYQDTQDKSTCVAAKFSKEKTSTTGFLDNLKITGNRLDEWKSLLFNALFQLMQERKNTIVENYRRYVELRLMQDYYKSNPSLHKEIFDAAKKGVVCDSRDPYDLEWDYHLVDRAFADELEEWIHFGIPGWSAYRKTESYLEQEKIIRHEITDDIRFFSSNFCFDDFVHRYQSDFDIIILSCEYGGNNSITNGCLFNIALIRDLMLMSSSEIHVDATRYSSDNGEPYYFDVSQRGFSLLASMDIIVKDLPIVSTVPFMAYGFWQRNNKLALPDDYFWLFRHQWRLLLEESISETGLIRAIPPLREAPRNFYSEDNPMVDIAKSSQVKRELNKWLRKLDTGYEIDFDIEETGYSLLLYDTRVKKMPVRISETGFGFSQMLPIIIECIASESACVLIEEPELHIHPRLQAELGSLFADAYKENGHQIIAETHSEHLMLRIQRLIRIGKLNPEDVSVLYVSRHETGSSVQQLRLDEDGEFIDLWPSGFFPEREKEVFGGQI